MRMSLGAQRHGVHRWWLLTIGLSVGFFLLMPPLARLGISATIGQAGKSADYSDVVSVFTAENSGLSSQSSEVLSLSGLNPNLRNLRLVLVQDDEAYALELQKANALMKRRNYEDALKSYKRANEMRGKKSAECFYGMGQAYFGLQAFKNVVESCDKAIELAGDNNDFRAQAYNLKGLGLQAQAELKDQKKLAEAENIFRQGLALKPEMPLLVHNLGVVLLQENRDPDGVAELERYVKLAPKGEFVEEARKMIANPRRAREPYAPDFSIVTAEGEHLTLEDLRGKVVMLDFWGTWCPPCVESLPSLRTLNKRYTKEAFVMIGVDCNDEEDEWRAFTTSNKMIWPQFRDREGRMRRAFLVDRFPTYILIDHEGIVRFRATGTSWSRAADLDQAIRKYVKIVAKSEGGN
jgi:thiol-disulfide isomerase/thioredoxin